MYFVKNVIFKMWILSKMRLWKCDFVKNVIFKMWIFSKMWFRKCEFCQKWHSENVNFVKNEIFKMWINWGLLPQYETYSCPMWYSSTDNGMAILYSFKIIFSIFQLWAVRKGWFISCTMTWVTRPFMFPVCVLPR